MKLWIDDIRPAPKGYTRCYSVNQAKRLIMQYEDMLDWDNNSINTVEIIDIDHDAGDYITDGGDYIKLLDWLEETNRSYPIHIHSMNPVGVENMRNIIRRNKWKEI